MKHFLNEPEKWADTYALSRSLTLDVSTVQRSVKKLHDKGILQKSQQNLDGGGYVFIYKVHPRNQIKNVILEIVQSWSDRLGQGLEEWESKGR